MLRASGFDGKAVSVLSVSPGFLLSRRTAPGLPLPYEVTPSDTQECFCSPCPACLFKRQHTITILLSFSLSPFTLHPLLCFALWPLPLAAIFSPKNMPDRVLPRSLHFIFCSPFATYFPTLASLFFFLPSLTLCFVHPFAFFSALRFFCLSLCLRSPPPLPSPSRLVSPITVQRAEARVSLCLLTWAHWAKPRTSPAQPRGRGPPALPR